MAAGDSSGWTRFWDRGGFWRAVLAAALYLAVYQAFSLGIGTLFGGQLDRDNLFGTPQSVLVGLLLPVLIGAAVILVFLRSVGWLPILTTQQPLAGRGWMWAAPVLVAVPIVLRLVGISYAAYPAGAVMLTMVAGLLIGFTEETVTRGVAVTMIRRAGHSEWLVMVGSSAIFALLHSTNAFLGQPLLTVLLTLGYTFAFGICMYLTLRVTRRLVWPILLHGLYDPTLFLSSGGIDQTAATTTNAALALAGPFNLVFIVLGLVGLLAVRGRAPTP